MARSYKHWSDDDIAYLKSEYHKADINEMAEKLGCTMSALHNKAFVLGLKRGQLTNRKLRKHDIEWLKKNYSKYSNRTIAIYLGTSLRYVKKLGIKYGIRKSEEYYKECAEHSKANRKRSIDNWRKQNPEKVREWQRRYRLKKKNYDNNG